LNLQLITVAMPAAYCAYPSRVANLLTSSCSFRRRVPCQCEWLPVLPVAAFTGRLPLAASGRLPLAVPVALAAVLPVSLALPVPVSASVVAVPVFASDPLTRSHWLSLLVPATAALALPVPLAVALRLRLPPA